MSQKLLQLDDLRNLNKLRRIYNNFAQSPRALAVGCSVPSFRGRELMSLLVGNILFNSKREWFNKADQKLTKAEEKGLIP